MRGILATVLTLTTMAADAHAIEYLAGSSGDDTIVYGQLAYRYVTGQCYYIVEAGPGICVFERSATTPYRGALRWVDYWSDPDSYPFGIDGDPSDDSYGVDRIYPADLYDESYIYCGYSGNVHWYITIEHRFYGVGYPCYYYYDDVEFPGDATMQIWGDGATHQYGSTDYLDGWDNADTLYGGGAGDYLHGGGGNDTLLGDYGSDRLYGDTCGGGTEYFRGGDYDGGSDRMYGGTGGCNAEMSGGDGGDELYGTNEDDLLDGGPGAKDQVIGNDGNDELWGGDGGDDKCDGGDGSDTCHDCCEPPLLSCDV